MSEETYISAFDVFENGRDAVDPVKLRAVRDALLDLRRQIRRKIDSGLPSSEATAAKSLLAAAETAEAVVGSLPA
ncbi:MAG: hypothetical protein LBI62_08135 [Candidatus Accumulibacter sp.]|jgi:hypothetical protein|nr:hypothetical protein [Accumulibacter sp.]